MLTGIDTSIAKEMLAEPDKYPDFCEYVRRYAGEPLFRWRPRPDDPEEFEEQTAFMESNARFAILLGGNGSGKSEAAAAKTARYLLEKPAPRKDTPFWIIGETYTMVCSVCWVEKLEKFIPKYAIANYDWYNSVRGWPFAVVLKDLHGTGTNWVIEFKSYEQGRAKFQAASIGGYWFNEEVPISIVEETQARCREYDSPGWADFTPIEVKSPEWIDRYDNPPQGWEFFHLNTAKNHYLAPGWFDNWIDTIPEDMRETRQLGIFASKRGQVFKEWRKNIHVIEPFEIPYDWRKIRGIDFGYHNHFCCLWGARDPDGVWYIYDEHFANEQLLSYHAEAINERPWSDHPVHGNTWSDHDAQSRRELQNHGITCTPAKKDVHVGIEHVRKLLMLRGPEKRPRLYVFNTCKNLIREMREYHWPDALGTGNRMRDPNDLPVAFDDHAVDALRYMLYSEETGTVKFSDPIQRQKKDWQLAGSRIGW